MSTTAAPTVTDVYVVCIYPEYTIAEFSDGTEWGLEEGNTEVVADDEMDIDVEWYQKALDDYYFDPEA